MSLDARMAERLRDQCLSAWPDLLGLWAFGSRVRGQERADSDLDLALLVPGQTEGRRRWDVAAELARELGFDVDLLDLRQASTVMAHQVLSTGECLFARQPDADNWVAFLFNEKLALDAARAPLMEQIQREGKVYGR